MFWDPDGADVLVLYDRIRPIKAFQPVSFQIEKPEYIETMQFLMIGMDGAHIEAFYRGWTPFMASLMDRAHHLPIKEELVARGWSHIALGQHGAVTGALYDRPDLDGTHNWSLKFKMADIPGLGTSVKPIWQALGDAGFRVGIMNVPTVFPAPEVNGFCVSGGGGGGPVVQDPNEELCHPKSILPTLLELGYIVDERPNSLIADKGFTRPSQIFDRLALKNERRVDAFLDLAMEFDIDFGFLVFKSSSVFAETLILAEQAAATCAGSAPDNELLEAAETYYRHFDKQVQRLYNAYPNTEIVMVSDHGSCSPGIYFNPNALLKKLGFQPKASRKRLISSAVQVAKKLIPYSLRLKLRKNAAINKGWATIATTPSPSAHAFAAVLGSWRHGIFVNDRERFGGPVEPAQIDLVAERVMEAINADPEARAHGVSAALRHNARQCGAPQYPDIVLSMPDSVASSTASGSPFAPFKMPASPLGLKSITDGRLLTLKSSKALAAHTTGRWEFADTETPIDLTAVYSHIVKRFDVH